jgi:GNAT superfamily N-acetyltransferase
MVSIRLATADDVPRIVEIVNSDTGDETIALMGSEELAGAYRQKLVEHEGIPNSERVTAVAEADDRVVGVIQYRFGDRGQHGRLAHLRILASLVGPLGVLRRAPRLVARMRAQIPIPPGSFYLTLVQVDPAYQGDGVGTCMLEWSNAEAKRLGARRMSLTTTLTNPAIKLYERCGYSITTTAAPPSYARRLQVGGRVLMERSSASVVKEA